MSDWQNRTLEAWTAELGPPIDFEETAHESLRLATHMIEAALIFPEWAQGFVAAARGDNPCSERKRFLAATELVRLFPVSAWAKAQPRQGAML